MGKSLFIYVKGTWKECTPYLNVGSTWKQVLEFNAKTAEVWKPWKSDEPEHVHTKVIIPAVAPTCTATGLTEGSKCSSCGEILVAQEAVVALGHQWTDWTRTEEPTETSEGKEQRSCTRCPETETTTVPKLDHTHNYISTPAKNATCTQKGNKAYYYCDGCQTYFDDQKQITTWDDLEIPATGEHDFNNTILRSDDDDRQFRTAATCDEDATYWVECRTCTQKNGDYFTADQCDKQNSDIEPKKALGHTEVVDAAVAATCTAPGLTEGKHCSVCNTIITAQTTIPVTEHSFTEEVVADKYLATDADCTQPAWYWRSCHCGESGYGHEGADTFPVGTALGHSWGDWITTTEATCTMDGVETRTCINNLAHTETRLINATGHSFTEEVVDDKYLTFHADCTSPAWYWRSCHCGESGYGHEGADTFPVGEPLGHDLSVDSGEETIPATCTAAALNLAKCSRCDYISADTEDALRVGEPLGHSYSTTWYYEDSHPYECYQKCTRAGCDERFYNAHLVGYSVTSSGDKYGFYCKNCSAILTEDGKLNQ